MTDFTVEQKEEIRHVVLNSVTCIGLACQRCECELSKYILDSVRRLELWVNEL